MLKNHPLDPGPGTSGSINTLSSLKKLIVLSHFFHFLLAFHGQFVLLFLNEEFLRERRAPGRTPNLLRSWLSRINAQTGPERSLRVRASQLEAPLGIVMQIQMGPLRMSGAGETSHPPGLSSSGWPAWLRGSSAVFPLQPHIGNLPQPRLHNPPVPTQQRRGIH